MFSHGSPISTLVNAHDTDVWNRWTAQPAATCDTEDAGLKHRIGHCQDLGVMGFEWDWIGLRENLQETIDFPIKYGAFL